MRLDRDLSPAGRLTGDHLSSAISSAVADIYRDHLGHAPYPLRVQLADDTLVVITGNVLTKAEHSLMAAGLSDEVLRSRAELQRVMRDDIVAAVEYLTARTLTACMSTIDAEANIGSDLMLFADRVTTSESSVTGDHD